MSDQPGAMPPDVPDVTTSVPLVSGPVADSLQEVADAMASGGCTEHTGAMNLPYGLEEDGAA